MMLETTTQCFEAAVQLLKEAESVTNEREHAAWWDKKVDVFLVIQNALESGAFKGEAYDELWDAKYVLNEAENVAGRYAND
ncbi:hypothetical protein 010DV004_272 [Bacillus phage 010DV004]|nr:hypothetical protein 010DV004_6 [Bacillus phage 010DV004]QZA69224.1 hypothetical protein 010DV005_6 [Bacillus phage 010DV005]QZA69792.1 hypothetical protein 043JT007_6 [Bacillus phage 043JT007]QZA69204.1 hypothetical protein 010DV004_272 [Bacillus phage 010DV004]QZA69484.1 hypothetical protein 010DV005_272 [Bacillus phage 010DV005]